MLWDEENRLTLINDNGMVSNYTYDHAGERAIKSYGGTQGVYINGAPAGSVDHSQNSYTIYVSPYLVVNKERFTKHIYAGTTRICSKIGTGGFNNQYRPGVFGITAGSINYMARAYQIAQSKTAYYKQLGIPPGPPTLKGVYAEPETTGNALPASNNTNNVVPAGWPRYPKFAEPGGPPGPPIQWGDSITNATVEAGFGYIGTGAVEELDRYFYHPDHIGSSSVITNAQGTVTECMAYMPFGEILASQKHTNYAVPYLFTSKELDSETGLYYFGARYYDPNEGRWWGVDPLAEKFPNSSPFVYCYGNPVRFIDKNGKYGTDGHYWTAYAMAVSLGLSNEKSIAFALKAENYDNIVSNTNSIQNTSFETRTADGVPTWANPLTQGSMHGLTGGSQEIVNFLANIETLNGNPDAIHLLGDSYAHASKGSNYKAMYPRARGHLWSNDSPDNIAKHQGQYNKYLTNLEEAIGLISGISNSADRTVFNIVSKIGNQQVRTDILKGFIASKVGQTYTTSTFSKSIINAFHQLGINYTYNSEEQRVFFGLFKFAKYTITVNGSQDK